MKTIKFRAWNKKEKKMLYTGYFLFNAHGFIGQGTTESASDLHYEDSEIMQFTGLLDKNGKEIYEGDIVRIGEAIWEIVWDENCYLLKAQREIGLTREDAGRSEILGNIYENPDLIKPF